MPPAGLVPGAAAYRLCLLPSAYCPLPTAYSLKLRHIPSPVTRDSGLFGSAMEHRAHPAHSCQPSL